MQLAPLISGVVFSMHQASSRSNSFLHSERIFAFWALLSRLGAAQSSEAVAQAEINTAAAVMIRM